MTLLKDVQIGLPFPILCKSFVIIRGSFEYYHYACDEFDDVGWGCGYRTLQTICSWIKERQHSSGDDNSSIPEVPDILKLQKSLIEIGDKSPSFSGSRQWIGSMEVAYCIDYFYKVQCRIIHCRNIKELESHTSVIKEHFEHFGSPIMMGGDRDCSSKGILGICESEDGVQLLILDPHFQGRNVSKEKLQHEGWIKWQKINTLDECSFYNLCCPLIKGET